MIYRLTILLCGLIVFSGCATQPISNAAAIHAPMERILNRHFLQPAQGTGEVTIKRDSGFGGSACSSRIFVDGLAQSPTFGLRRKSFCISQKESTS